MQISKRDRDADEPILSSPPPSTALAMRRGATPPPPESLEEGAPAKLITAIMRRAWIIGACTLGALVLGAIYIAATPNRYYAAAVVVLNPQNEVTPVDEAANVGQPLDASFIATEIEQMRSRKLIAELVANLRLESDPEFANQTTKSPAILREQVITEVSDALSVRRRQTSHAIDIGFTVSTPEKAATMANTLTDLYLNSMVEARLNLARHRDLWLAQRTEELRQDLTRKEQALAEYRAKTGQIEADGTTLPAIRARAIEDSALELIRTSAEKRARLAQVEQLLKNGGSLDSVAEVLNSGTIRDLRARQIEASRLEAELAQRYSAAHPDRVKAAADREAVDREIRTELGRITTSLRNEVAIIEAQRNVLTGHQNDARLDMDRNGAFMTTLNALERDAATTREVYESYLRSGQELQDQATLKPLNARLMSPASPPLAPAGAGAGMILFAMSIFGAIFGFAAALVMSLNDDRIYSVEDAERRLDARVLAAIHDLNPAHRRFLPRKFSVQDSARDKAVFDESFRFLRLALQSRLQDRARVVAITSSTTNEGKTTIATHLAQASGDAGKRVLLIECDLRQQSLSKHIGSVGSASFFDILEQRSAWRDCLTPVSSGVEAILGVGGTLQTLDWRHTATLNTVMEEMRADYDLILLDCPPVLALAEATLLSQAADGVLFVTRIGHTSASDAALALKQLSAAGCNILGTVVNRLDPFALGANARYFSHVQKYYA